MNTTREVSNLPDYPSIKKLASALHQLDASQHGAAIMIGAGFSRCAARHVGGEKKMPLWDSFTKKLLAELNPGDSNSSFSDPLRVAEEYRSYFGQSALNDRIRSEIDNDAWRTGELYRSMLELPWSEVMTTNWDTLLERAAEGVHGPYYTPVTKPTDLTWASSPRIVKLHGTIGTTDTFIAAQEDYRTYPERFAPFVNFARQVFIENELCLLGFSGDDPNFLHWAGWVRDHLADHARKIYLVGALKLTAARRKHLESINIAPIDLWEAVKDIDDRDLMHQTATELFLRAMLNEGSSKVEPHKWSPQDLHRPLVTEADMSRSFNDHQYAATLLQNQLGQLQKDRESYPGWLVCPPSLRWQVQSQLSDPHPNIHNIAALEPSSRDKLLYEMAWRHSITFEAIAPWLIDKLFQVASSSDPIGISKRQQMEVALVLLKNSRWLSANDEIGQQTVQGHVNLLTALLEKHARYLPDCAAELAYHRALIARDGLNYERMETLSELIAGEDPVWKLRRSALLMELGRFDEGKELIAKAYGELRESHRRDRYSISVLSRLMWAHFLLEAANRGNFNQTSEVIPAFADNQYRKWKCDPWTWIENIQEKANKQQDEFLKSRNPIEPLFGQGHYRDNSSQLSFNNETSAFLLLDGIARDVGIPLRSGSAFMNVNLLAGAAEKLVLAGGVGVELWNFTLANRAASSESSPAIKGIFTRIGVARASQAAVDETVIRVLSGIDYWRVKRSHGTTDQQGYALSALRVLMEILARLVVRVSPEKAKEVFRLTVSLGKQQSLQHDWLSEVFDALLTNSLESIPKTEHGDLLSDALTFPLPSEVNNGNLHRWPNPVIDYPSSRESNSTIENRIDELIAIATPNGTVSSSDALLRLLPLCKKVGFLTQAEHGKLAHVLWGDAPTYQELPDVSRLYPHAFLFLPAPEAEKVRSLLSRHLYENHETILMETQKEIRRFPSSEIHQALMIYEGISGAALNETYPLFPTPEQALTLFDLLTAWRPRENSEDTFGFESGERTQLVDSIGKALSYAITPSLSTEARNFERFEKLSQFCREVEESTSAIPALVYFVGLNESAANSVEKILRKSLQCRDPREVSYAAIAMQKWMGLSEADNSTQLNRLISKLIEIIESGRTVGLQQLLWIAGELFNKQRLTVEQVSILMDAIPDVFFATDYATIDPISPEAINASSIKEACVKLASSLSSQHPEVPSLTRLLEKARLDALPEVRFSISS